jgi:hypothetical protein
VTEADQVRRVRELAMELRRSLVGEPTEFGVIACLELATQLLKEARGATGAEAAQELITVLEGMRAADDIQGYRVAAKA